MAPDGEKQIGQSGFGDERQVWPANKQESGSGIVARRAAGIVRAPAGSRGAINAAAELVPVETRIVKPRAESRSTSGKSAKLSPTLAPCSQARGPSGPWLGRPAEPLAIAVRFVAPPFAPYIEYDRAERREGRAGSLINGQNGKGFEQVMRRCGRGTSDEASRK